MGEYIEEPFGPLLSDGVAIEDYNRACGNLRDFLSLDVFRLCGIEDLSAEASLVAGGFRRIIVSDGHIQETKFEYESVGAKEQKAVSRVWAIRKQVDDRFIFATVPTEDRVYVESYKLESGEQLSVFCFMLPVGDILPVGGVRTDDDSDILMDMSRVYAADWRSGVALQYYPMAHPGDPRVQQGFARVVQDDVRDVLRVVGKL